MPPLRNAFPGKDMEAESCVHLPGGWTDPFLPLQIQRWGKVEWAHDFDLHELRARTAAGVLFTHLCLESSTVKHKLLQDSGPGR